MLSDILNINQNSFFSCLAAGLKKKLSASLTFCIRILTVTVADGTKIKIFQIFKGYKFSFLKTTTKIMPWRDHNVYSLSPVQFLWSPPPENQCINLMVAELIITECAATQSAHISGSLHYHSNLHTISCNNPPLSTA